MTDCPHKTPMKLFIIHQYKGRSGIPSYAGYFICADCGDYLCTGWTDLEDVWNDGTELYSMLTISQEKGSTAQGLAPIDIFKDWITNDLKSFPPEGDGSSEILPP